MNTPASHPSAGGVQPTVSRPANGVVKSLQRFAKLGTTALLVAIAGGSAALAGCNDTTVIINPDKGEGSSDPKPRPVPPNDNCESNGGAPVLENVTYTLSGEQLEIDFDIPSNIDPCKLPLTVTVRGQFSRPEGSFDEQIGSPFAVTNAGCSMSRRETVPQSQGVFMGGYLLVTDATGAQSTSYFGQ